MNPFVERHQGKIAGVLSCLDRVVVTGTLPDGKRGVVQADLLLASAGHVSAVCGQG